MNNRGRRLARTRCPELRAKTHLHRSSKVKVLACAHRMNLRTRARGERGEAQTRSGCPAQFSKPYFLFPTTGRLGEAALGGCRAAGAWRRQPSPRATRRLQAGTAGPEAAAARVRSARVRSLQPGRRLLALCLGAPAPNFTFCAAYSRRAPAPGLQPLALLLFLSVAFPIFSLRLLYRV